MLSGIVLGLAALPLAGTAGAQGQQTLGWAEAINQAMEANQSLAAARQGLAATQENLSIARADLLPTVHVPLAGSVSESATFSESAGVIPSETLMVGAAVSQMIYNERVFADRDIQKELFASQQDQFENQRLGIVATAGQAYIGVLLAEALLGVQEENLELTRQNLAIAEVREQAGAGTYQEVLRLQSQVYSNQRQLLAQQSNVLVNRFALNQVRNRPAEDAAELEQLSVERDGFVFSSEIVAAALADETKARIVRDYLVGMGLSNSPSLRSLDREIEAQTRQLTSNRRWLVPSAQFTAGADAFLLTGGQRADEVDKKWFWKLGAALSWTPFDGAASTARVRQTSAELQSLRLQRVELQSSLEQGVRANVAVAMSSYQAIGLAQAQADTAARNFGLVRDSYLEGESSLVTLLDAQEQTLAANSSLTTALHQFLSDLLAAEQTMGFFPFLEPQDEVVAKIRDLERLLQN